MDNDEYPDFDGNIDEDKPDPDDHYDSLYRTLEEEDDREELDFDR